MKSILSFHSYKYFPYEKVLARREASRLLGPGTLLEHPNHIEISGAPVGAEGLRLTYFAETKQAGVAVETLQARLERAGATTRNRQSTRYSVHGLHEYKGKFNPQIVKAILNIFGIGKTSQVLDPFCGSGTTLVECAHMGAGGIGYDLNPFAVFVANAKLQALATPAADLSKIASKLKTSLSRSKPSSKIALTDERLDYLASWFEPENLAIVDLVRTRIDDYAGDLAPIFLSVASNLLRDYSLQDPNDLRIRRRKSPTPNVSFIDTFLDATAAFIEKLQDAQMILGVQRTSAKAVLHDTTVASAFVKKAAFDAAVTSPPYAMALPYIDTQRLSLVWLGLSAPSDIQRLEADLVGSREMRGTSRRALDSLLNDNDSDLPPQEYRLCRELASSLASTDGFRRVAVPGLLYRYFKAMQASFQAVRQQMKSGAPYALVVGHNHTTLGGKRFDIDTPTHLASLAKHAGWLVDEMIPLQTYQRYGYHMGNAVAAETLILLRRP